MPRPRLYADGATKQRAFRRRQAALRAEAIRKWVAPPQAIPGLTKLVPWLSALIRERDDLKKRLEAEAEYARIGRAWEEDKKRIQTEKDEIADKLAAAESAKRRREQRSERQRERRQADPAAEALRRAALPFGDRLAPDRSSPFAQTAPTIGPNSGQIDPTDWTRSRQSYPTFAPGIPPDRDTIGPRIAPDRDKDGTKVSPTDRQDWLRYVGIPRVPIAPPRSATPAPAPAAKAGGLLEKIKKAGYTTDAKTQRVLYGGNRWITPEEWVKLMPGILD